MMSKLIVSLVLIVILGVIFLGWGIGAYYAALTDHNLEQEEPRNKAYISVGKVLANTVPPGDQQILFLEHWGTHEEFSLSIIREGNLALPPSLLDNLRSGETVTLESKKHLSFYFKTNNTGEYMVLDIDAPQDNNEYWLPIALTLTFYIGITIIIFMWLYPLIRALQRLRRTAIDFGSGELFVRLKLNRMSLISEIEREFNRMADRIVTLIEDNKLLSRAVSHDLKTPLARLRFGVETLAEEQDQQQREIYHLHIDHDLREMESLVNTLLEYARLDEINVSIEKEPLNLSDLVAKILHRIDGNCEVKYCFTGDCIVKGDEKYLRMLIHNLLQNARDYCQKKIFVTIETNAESVIFSVEDDGNGILSENRDTVFKPFVKGGEMKKSGMFGHGMGLAIVSRIAQWHDGNVLADESPVLKGARFIVKFPRI